MHEDVERVLFSEEQIQERIRQLGKQITEDYKGRDLLVICVLRGAVLFMTDLIKRIDMNLTIDFIQISSYGSGTVSKGVATVITDLNEDIKGRDILVVEDILDTHLTVDLLKELLGERSPKSFTVCSLLYKRKDDPRSYLRDFEKYIGFECDDEFVVGYGLDYDQCYRNLPYIGILKKSVYESAE